MASLKTGTICTLCTYFAFHSTLLHAVADLGEGPGGPGPPPLFWVKKEEMTEGKMADRASKSRPDPPLAQGLDPPLAWSYK